MAATNVPANTLLRAHYPVLYPISTRWMDNDAYGHVNNVVYCSWFDTAVNATLVGAGLLDIIDGAVIGLVVETGCRYHRSVAFPEGVEVGVRVAQIGRSSTRWELAVFTVSDPEPAATGFLVHVYVDRTTRRPTPLTNNWLSLLSSLAQLQK